MYATNAARFEQAYRDIAVEIKIAGREDPKADIFKLVHDWLRGCEEMWLIILDNVDDANFFVNAQVPSKVSRATPAAALFDRFEIIFLKVKTGRSSLRREAESQL